MQNQIASINKYKLQDDLAYIPYWIYNTLCLNTNILPKK